MAHAQWLTYVGRSPPAVCEGGEPVLPRPLARLSSEKAALVRHFRCTEFELCARVAIKLDASSMETTRIRAPLVASSLRSNADSPRPPRLSNARSFLDSASNLYVECSNTEDQLLSGSGS